MHSFSLHVCTMSARPSKTLETKSHKRIRLEGGDQDALAMKEQFPAEQQKPEVANTSCTKQQQQRQDAADPFAWCLRCQTVPDRHQQSVVWWFSPDRAVPTEVELALEPILVPYKDRERGMFKTQPARRLRQVQRACREHRIKISSALSLRRHLMRQYNPDVPMASLGLGKFEDVDGAARIFEESVKKELVKLTVDFYAEEEQKRFIQEHKKPETPYPPTPDFVLKKSMLIKKYFMRHQKRRVFVERSINWIEVKMFYGASSIEMGGNSAVGNLLNTARKYVRVYGPGAMIFSFGFGEGLAATLEAEGVLCLDCSGMVDLEPVEAHQRTWCADRQGNILP